MITIKDAIHTLLKAYSHVYGSIRSADNTIVFFSNPPYYGNTKAIYEYIKNNRLDKKYGIDLIWISYSKNTDNIFKKYNIKYCNIKSIKCINKYLRARVHIADSVFIREKDLFKSKNTIFLLTWHGIPFKSKQQCWHSRINNVVDFAISTSFFASTLLSAFLGICPSKFRVTGYPRNDKLLSINKNKARKIISRILSINDIDLYDKIILYTPTFRHADKVAGVPNSTEGVPVDELANMPEKYLKELNKVLAKYNALLIVKYHHYDEYYYKKNKEFLSKIYNRQTDNIKLLTTDDMNNAAVDIYDVLPGVDVLITDYSSIFYDYLLLNRPIVFYMYDLEEYIRDRGLIVDAYSVEEFVPGPIARTPREFIELIRSIVAENQDYWVEKRSRLSRLIHAYRDAYSSRRVWELISGYLEA